MNIAIERASVYLISAWRPTDKRKPRRRRDTAKMTKPAPAPWSPETGGDARISVRPRAARREGGFSSSITPTITPPNCSWSRLADDWRIIATQAAIGQAGIAANVMLSDERIDRWMNNARNRSIANEAGTELNRLLKPLSERQQRAVNFWITVEQGSTGKPHLHIGTDLPDSSLPALRRILRQLAGPFKDHGSKSHTLRIKPYDPGVINSYTGWNAGLGWASYCVKDLQHTPNQIGQRCIYIPPHTKALGQMMWQDRPALLDTLNRARSPSYPGTEPTHSVTIRRARKGHRRAVFTALCQHACLWTRPNGKTRRPPAYRWPNSSSIPAKSSQTAAINPLWGMF